jgi:tetratricopeptide (TPR) repeat protein
LPTEGAPGYVVEAGKRLSESILWRLQRDLYDARGIQPWSRGDVPQSITTSPYIARAYAQITLGYVRDIQRQLNPSEPLYVVELGAGSGRFGYRFVKQLAHQLKDRGVRFTYVMTDVSPSLTDFWQRNASLRPFVDSGQLDFAYFDAIRLGDIELINSKRVLRQDRVVNPLVVIGNYFVDSIPHDCFSVQDHQLFENLVRVVSDQPELTLTAGQTLSDLNVTFEAQPARAAYYPESELNQVLENYRQHLDDAMFLLPVAGIRCMRHFQTLSANRALFLLADIGSARESDIREYTSGGISADSNFWLSVNFHAVGGYVRELGGAVMHPAQRHANLNISAFVLGGTNAQFGETALAYEQAIGQLGPDDFFVLSSVIAGHLDSLRRGELLAFLRASGWDSDYFLQCLPFLLDSLQETGWSGREDVRRAVAEAWEAYYPIGDTSDAADLPSGFGVLLYTIGDYAEAMEYFQRSLELVGMDARTTFNVALCLNRLGRQSEAAEWINRTLELDPQSEQALAMRTTLDLEDEQSR